MYIIMNKATALIVICKAKQKKKNNMSIRNISLVCSSSVINYKGKVK